MNPGLTAGPGLPIPLHRVAPVPDSRHGTRKCCRSKAVRAGGSSPAVTPSWSGQCPLPRSGGPGAFALALPAAFWAGFLCLQRPESYKLHFPGAPAAGLLKANQVPYAGQHSPLYTCVSLGLRRPLWWAARGAGGLLQSGRRLHWGWQVAVPVGAVEGSRDPCFQGQPPDWPPPWL